MSKFIKLNTKICAFHCRYLNIKKDFNNSRLLPRILVIFKQVVISKKHKPSFRKGNNVRTPLIILFFWVNEYD